MVDQWQLRRLRDVDWTVGEVRDPIILPAYTTPRPECEAECRLLSPTAKIPSIHSFEEDMEVRDMAGAW